MDLSGLGASTGGAWTTADALAAGLSRATVQRRLVRGDWQRLAPGVMCDGGIEPTATVRAWAAVLAAGGPGRAWADGRTVARLLGLPLLDDGGGDDVAVTGAGRTRALGSVQVRRLSGPVLVGRLDGVPAVAPAAALLTLARVLPGAALVCALDAALHRHVIAADAVAPALTARRAGTVALRTAFGLADLRSESPAETLARLALRPVLPRLQPQVRVRDAQGRVVARLDLADEQARFGVEVDGLAGHAGPLMVLKDRARDRRTAALGWHVERVGWAELRTDPRGLAARIAAAHRGICLTTRGAS